jgi:hypothetical protein
MYEEKSSFDETNVRSINTLCDQNLEVLNFNLVAHIVAKGQRLAVHFSLTSHICTVLLLVL